MKRWSVAIPKSHRVGFYPGCGRDVRASAAILAPFVDRILYCDIDARLIPYWERLKLRLPPTPACEFVCGDAHSALVGMSRIAVAFQRRDSPDGSRLSIVRGRLLRTILDRFPASGGIFITDGCNLWPNQLRRLTRQRGVTSHGWRLAPAPDQPLRDSEGLWIIRAIPEAKHRETQDPGACSDS